MSGWEEGGVTSSAVVLSTLLPVEMFVVQISWRIATRTWTIWPNASNVCTALGQVNAVWGRAQNIS